MRDFLEYIAKLIVQKPDQVQVEEKTEAEDDLKLLILRVHPEDMGLVIGKKGRVAEALRNLLKVVAIHGNQRFMLKILSTEETPPETL